MAMSETISEARPRKRDAQATRARILAAAMEQFARGSYEKVSLRDISSEAGVDVALISRYFGGKEGLFTEALKASIHPDRLKTWDHAGLPGELARSMAGGRQESEDAHASFQFLLRAATSPTTAPLLNVAVQERYLAPIADWLGGEDAQPRARVFAAVMIGFLVERLIRGEALEGREREIFTAQAQRIFASLVEDQD